MTILEPAILGKRMTPNQYRATQMTLKLDDFNTLDKVQLHRKIGDVLYRYVLNKQAAKYFQEI